MTSPIRIPIAALTLVLLALASPAASAAPVAAQVWSLDPDPMFELNGMSEDTRYALSEVVGGVRLPDGSVVVADRIANGLKLFSPDGEFIREVGGKGQGPGEYEFIRGMGHCADGAVSAFDLHWGLKVYDPELNLLEERRSSTSEAGRSPYQLACNSAGYELATGWGTSGTQLKEGYHVAMAPILLTSRGEIIHDFGERLSSERVGYLAPDGQGGSVGPHPFGRQTSVAIGPGRAYLGSASDYLIEVYDLVGNPLPSITWTGPPREINRRHLAAFLEEQLASRPEEAHPRIRTSVRDLPELELFPAYDQLLLDQSGNLWVRYFPQPGGNATDWVIFDEDGVKVGELSLPRRATLLEAGDDYVLVSEPDDFDVPNVRVYRLIKG